MPKGRQPCSTSCRICGEARRTCLDYGWPHGFKSLTRTLLSDVRYGSLAEVEARPRGVRSSPNSRHHSTGRYVRLVPEGDIAGAADLFSVAKAFVLAHAFISFHLQPDTFLRLERIERELRILANTAVVGTAPSTARGEIREDKAANRKAALTKAGGKYQEQVNRPWRTFQW